MPIDVARVAPVVWTRYGAEAYDALPASVAELKRADPLAPVTVLVPTQLCGVAARRALAKGVSERAGVAGLSVLTVDRLAERIAAPALVGSGRRPTTGPVLAAAWRRALGEDAGVFGPVAGHRSTVRALVEAHRELREVDAAALDAIAGSGEPIAVDLVRLHRRVIGLLAADWYDTRDLRETATAVLTVEPTRTSEIGAVVLFLPQDLPLAAVTLVQQVATFGDVRTIAGLTGNARADAAVLRSLGWLAAESATRPTIEPATAHRVVHASDADDEVRCVIRLVAERLHDTPAHRVAVLYAAAEPYARLLAEHLTTAGIVSNGTGVRPTIERTLARTVLDVLALPDHGWRRDEVLAVLAEAPVRDADGRRAPASRWDRISRLAGVVGGEDWETRLAAYAVQERDAAELVRTSDTPSLGLIARRERDADAADALRTFVADLRRRLDVGASLGAWSELAGWAGDTYLALVGDLEEEPWLPEDEARAAEKVQRVVSGLAGLGAIEATADLTALRLTLELELADDLPRRGRFGDGVLVAPLSAAIGLDADVVFIVGLAEDLVPGRLSEDALLPERVRALTGGQLSPLRDRLDRQRRHLLAAFVAAPECIASFPRGDLRRSSSRLPSRWLLPTLRALSGQWRLEATRWESLSGSWLIGSPSYAAGLGGSDVLATEQEWRTRASVAGRDTGRAVDETLPQDHVVRQALAMVRARRSDALTRFDGDVSGHAVPNPTAADRVVSPTSLEAWATCPHAYFVERLLRVEPVQSPEELVEISPLEVGSLIHEALDRYFADQSQAGAVPYGAQLWTTDQRAALRRIVSDVAMEYEARGVTGHRLLWQQERHRILTDLERLLDDDEELRACTGRQQVLSELGFGMGGVAPVEVRLPDGRTMRFRGSADRVDRAGDAIVVVDYKTGSMRKFKDIGEADPTVGGTKLQLPVYAYAARAALGADDAPVSAEYWFLRKNRGQRIDLPLTPHVHAVYIATLSTIADGIAGGLFPHRPPEDDGWASYIECPYCDPDGLGVKEHRDRWERKRHDPRLAAYVALVDPDAAAAEETP
jgi:ATP-dependent helicase/nuclease subunit B